MKSSSEFNLVFRGGITYPESVGIEESRPLGLELELTDSENVNVVGSGMVGNAPPNCVRKLKQSMFGCLFGHLFVWPTHTSRC